MADLVKKNGGHQQQQIEHWNPFRAMRELFSWDPFREMAPLSAASLDRMAWNPTFDVTENKDSYMFKADVPGVAKEDLEISTTGNRIRISGKRDISHEEKSDTIYTYERQYGSFCRSFTLPEGADVEHAKSELRDGVLTLAIPKLTNAHEKKIPISTAGSKS